MRLNICVTLPYFFTQILAVIISQNTITTNQRVEVIASLTINEGVFYSIIHNNFLTLLDKFENAGRLYVTASTGSQASLLLTGIHFKNSGVIVFESFPLGESTYHIYAENFFENNGVMLFGTLGESSGITRISVLARESWTNTGMMFFVESRGLPSHLLLGKSNSTRKNVTITNEGTICFKNLFWRSFTRIEGYGCIAIGFESTFEVDISKYSVSPLQIFSLDPTNSRLIVRGLKTPMDEIPVIKVVGLGEGNSIEVEVLYRQIAAWEFSSPGLFSLLIADTPRVTFDLGPEYSLRDFQVSASFYGCKITVHRPVPPLPLVCRCDVEFPSAPTALP
ncbi:hypothetical protein METBIDRAFT_30457 [Metschnikowia bicuspidata var. bicuspidata NRRL YB-4993]|uniref:Hyphally-regulated cell wall protein N-terminal domain-containing protein n=1 Tax=Metschnikowia bicuspidata var. bicuspidata NRRL YB-4993 TaxID=869754 RepID=A0A1A0HIY0_9ASCO|nr:hypothetical protein METBIDRAFT_30457 [Metschnikowia bicuspidata var. bicuspidata NRRL YB-4993]OBA24114.1 hypothetical protein METBIDRAFT_30457 [Metschnikowia bicuspidata var. bicuspidata NRRL YB-4993]